MLHKAVVEKVEWVERRRVPEGGSWSWSVQAQAGSGGSKGEGVAVPQWGPEGRLP